MKRQAILIKSTKCFYLCGGSSIKCFNNGIDKLQYPNMGITNFWSVEAIQSLHNTLGCYKVLTTIYQGCDKVENIANP